MRRVTIKKIDRTKAISAEGQVGEFTTAGSLRRYYLCNQGRASNFFVALLGKNAEANGESASPGKPVSFRRHWARRNHYRIKDIR